MGTLGVVLLCLFLATSVYGSPTPVVYDTIVVGLGVSGTAAASRLAAAGRKVLALEAQDRIGGRVHTIAFGDGVVEVGAEWIHGTENSATYELAIKNNITILDQNDMDIKAYRSDGTSDREDLITELCGVALKAFENPPNETLPVGQYIKQTILNYIKEKNFDIENDSDFLENLFHYLEAVICTYDAPNSWQDVTTTSKAEELGGSQTMSWHKYGYKTLFEILLNKYNNGPGYSTLDIKLNTEVVKIQWPQDPKDNVVVTVADGSMYISKNVIVTVSVGVLKEKYAKLFSPSLTADKTLPIQSIAMGICNKIILRFAYTWWDPNTYYIFMWHNVDRAKVSEADKWMFSVDGTSEPLSSNTSLTFWTCGDAAKTIENIPNDVVKDKIMGLVRKFMSANRTIPEPVDIFKSSWYSNPFTRGVYTYDDINTPKHPTVRTDLGQPLVDTSGAPRVLFAGEATNSKHFATVHGAIESGWREADRLLSAENH